MWASVTALVVLAACLAIGAGEAAGGVATEAASEAAGAAASEAASEAAGEAAGEAPGEAAGAGERYMFYRNMGASVEDEGEAGGGGTRRVFGGAAAELKEFPRVLALLDRYWAARCSGAALAPHWALTAAHCVTPRLAYVKYNTRRPASPDGDFAPVHYLYRHPQFEVVQTTGEAPDVTLLHHDVGLVRTREAMRLHAAAPGDVRAALRHYDPARLRGEEVQVLGFGRTERSVLGEELFGVRLALAPCARASWLHVTCGAPRGASRGVCAGDSGGPVLYRDYQVGVTSMGPVSCARGARAGRGAAGAEGATSVFTVVFPYADVINATMADADAELRMTRLSRAPPAPPAHALPLLLAATTAAAAAIY